ncbi:MAG TPA: cyclase family protein, partial [Elusimicrobiota bacterium]|nr:cyclase family protein [Elusimicrobiota bacterium]
MKRLLAFLLCLAPALARAQTVKGRLVDLTHPFDSQTIFWPTENGFQLEKEFDGTTPGGYYYASNKFCTAEHGGTHVDAPHHFNKAGNMVDEISLTQLVGPAVLVDVSAVCAKARDYQVRVSD